MKFRHVLLWLLTMSGTPLLAEHLPGGNITYECLGGNQYAFTLTLFRDCGGVPLIPQNLNVTSDCGVSYTLTMLPVGSGMEVSQLCPADLPNSTCNGGTLPGIEVYRVETTLTLTPCVSWTVSWSECCRNDSQNIQGNPGTYVEARLNTILAPCNNSPVFTQDVIPYVCVNDAVNYNLAVTESDGHDLRYHLIAARHSQPPVSVLYSEGNTGMEPVPGMAIDILTGQITFSPTMIGNIVTVVRVDEYLSTGELIGSVMRDFLFVVTACPNTPPDPASGAINITSGDTISSNASGFSMCTTGAFCFNAIIQDVDAGQSLTLTSNVATVLPGATFNTSGTNPVTVTICRESDVLQAGTYGFVITAEDDACPTPAIGTFAYTITVLADTAAACLGTAIPLALDEGLDWAVWPSPADEFLHVRLASAGAATLRLLDVTGRIVREERLSADVTTIGVGDLPAGLYTAWLRTGGRDLHQRIMLGR